jgi:hypothetical protein
VKQFGVIGIIRNKKIYTYHLMKFIFEEKKINVYEIFIFPNDIDEDEINIYGDKYLSFKINSNYIDIYEFGINNEFKYIGEVIFIKIIYMFINNF